MIPYSKQTIDNKDLKKVIDVLKSDFLTQGSKNTLFEKKVREFTTAKYGTSTNSATSALHISCLALGLKKNDYVWTVPNTFVASANCGALCGAKVDFVDIDINSFNISIKKLNEKLVLAKKQKKLPKILIPVHFAGTPYDQEEVFKLSKQYKFKIIEDASHALGATYKNNTVGSCKWSDITVFSFHPVKPITTAEGGIAVTNNKKIFDKLKVLRNHGITKEKKELKIKKNANWYYEMQTLGLNYRLNEIEATLGISQLEKIKVFNFKRNQIAKKYKKAFVDTPIKFQSVNTNIYSSYHLFVILFPNHPKILKNCNKIFKEFYKNNLAVMLHYSPVHLQPFYKKKGFKIGDFPVSENYAKRAFSIPNFPKLKLVDQKNVIKKVFKILKIYYQKGK